MLEGKGRKQRTCPLWAKQSTPSRHGSQNGASTVSPSSSTPRAVASAAPAYHTSWENSPREPRSHHATRRAFRLMSSAHYSHATASRRGRHHHHRCVARHSQLSTTHAYVEIDLRMKAESRRRCCSFTRVDRRGIPRGRFAHLARGFGPISALCAVGVLQAREMMGQARQLHITGCSP